MAEYTLEYINHATTHEAEAFMARSEANYQKQVEEAAKQILDARATKPIVLVNGPSSSSKTTTTMRLCELLEAHGVHAKMLSMDDYYRSVGEYEMPMDTENGVMDWESPECMNLPLLSKHLSQIAAGEEVLVPRFDFASKQMHENDHALRLDADEIVLIEGIHAFNPVIMGDLKHMATSIYLSVASAVVMEDGTVVDGVQLRFLRRAMRDSLFRGSPVKETLQQWKSVVRGEKLYIQPNAGQANVMIDTFLPFEIAVLAPKLRDVLEMEEAALRAADLPAVLPLVQAVEAIDYAPYLSAQSVLHEFIG